MCPEIQSTISSASRFPSYTGISIFALAPILATALIRHAYVTYLSLHGWIWHLPTPSSWHLPILWRIRCFPVSSSQRHGESSFSLLQKAKNSFCALIPNDADLSAPGIEIHSQDRSLTSGAGSALSIPTGICNLSTHWSFLATRNLASS
jgi:hypothetical protein